MQRAHPPERSLQPLLVAPADVAVDPFRQQALSARIPQGSLDGCHALPISLNKRQRGLSIVSASPLNCAISKVAGIKASESSGSAAFFFHCYPKKNSLTNSLEHRTALSSVSVFVGLFDSFWQAVGNQCLQLSLAVALIQLPVVPAFELQHVQGTVHLRDL